MDTPITILYIDDDEEDFLIIRNIMGKINNLMPHTLTWTERFEEALDAMKNHVYDLYLIDYRLGADDGLDLIRKAVAHGCLCPMILLTGQGDAEIDRQALAAGASDFLVKSSVTPEQLARSMRYGLARTNNLREIRQLNEALEERVKERTAELAQANEALVHEIHERQEAQRKTQEALAVQTQLNELKSRFLSMASHEFRTPLSAILSSASLISRYTESSQQAQREKHVGRIKASVSNLNTILDDFLSLTRLEEGKITPNLSHCTLPEFCRHVIEEVEPMAKKEQTLAYTHEGPPDVSTDSQMLHNILLNLLSNAIKYSPEGRTVILKSQVAHNTVCLVVEDEGIGIPEEDQQHLFERFFRAKNVTNIQGTGLGLNIVAGYVEVLGGRIDFTSTVGKGSQFTIYLPQEPQNAVSQSTHEENTADRG